jgi:alginate O-acetyltransferase complex protein AlgI
MQFDSLLFLLFFTSVVSIYYVLPHWRAQKILLLAASYIFYASYSPPLIILIWFSTLIVYFLAKQIHITTKKGTRKLLITSGLIANLSVLFYFKYASFLLGTFSFLLSKVGVQYNAPEMNIILPIGISFYTFQALSYLIDIYRQQIEPEKDLIDFALYITFFPQLVAGPIVRASHFLPQCKSKRKGNLNDFSWGLTLLLFGIFVKIVLADKAMAPIADTVFSAPETSTWLDSWVGIFAFSGQIFYDFSGYSICAIGAAKCFGFDLPENFRAPYASLGFAEFWHRWHISLSTWLRDYLYISLGGSRKTNVSTYINLLFTMFLAGLWHGASWTFVLWGGIHGIFLILERSLKKHISMKTPGSSVQFFLALGTFFLISLIWVIFRAENVSVAMQLYNNILHYTPQLTLSKNSVTAVLSITIGTFLWHFHMRGKNFETYFKSFSIPFRALIISSSLILIGLCSTGDSRAFIYFQF